LYCNPDTTGHIDVDCGLAGVAGVAGIAVFTETTTVLAPLVPHEFVAVTVIFPPMAVPEVETVIEFVFMPAVIFQPEGKVHVYDVAFATGDTLYISPVLLIHCSIEPLIAPGIAGAAGLTVTAKVLCALAPQLFPAVTLMLPF
jgi:hypothetical protein